MPQFSPDGVPQYPEWKAEALDALYAQFRMLDSAGAGIDRSKLRTFYPHVGWNDLQNGLNALVKAGRLSQSITYVDGKQLEVYVWKGQ